MNDTILVLNAGSSSIKFAVFESAGDSIKGLRCRGEVAGIGQATATFCASQYQTTAQPHPVVAPTHESALDIIFTWLKELGAGLNILAVGHRVVHGGTRFTGPVRIDPRVRSEIEALIPLAPLHQPHHLRAIDAISQLHPQLPQIACFDTAFHHTLPPRARRYALPRTLHDAGIRHYGFHGLSYEYIRDALPQYLGDAPHGRTIIAHLGNGASMCAIKDGASIETTMGFTPLDGLPMGTRCGAIDPGVLLYLMQAKAMNVTTVADLLYHQSGLLGMSGISSDVQQLLASTAPEAAEAIDYLVYRAGCTLGALTAALGGLDTLVFTAGIGEHAASIRQRICQDARWLGITLDEPANRGHGPRISATTSTVSVWVIPTNEELMIARHTLGVCRT